MKNFIDIQYFNLPNRHQFIIKELAILKNNGSLAHYIFKPPFPFSSLVPEEQQQVRWVTENCFGLPWQMGTTSYEDLDEILKNLRHDVFHSKGAAKIRWLQKNKIKAKNIKFSLSTKLLKNKGCIFHEVGQRKNLCALRNVHYYKILNKLIDFK